MKNLCPDIWYLVSVTQIRHFLNCLVIFPKNNNIGKKCWTALKKNPTCKMFPTFCIRFVSECLWVWILISYTSFKWHIMYGWKWITFHYCLIWCLFSRLTVLSIKFQNIDAYYNFPGWLVLYDQQSKTQSYSSNHHIWQRIILLHLKSWK